MTLKDKLKQSLKALEDTVYYKHSLIPLNEVIEIGKIADLEGDIEVKSKAEWEREGLVIRPQSFVRRGKNRRTQEGVDAWTRERIDYYYERFRETAHPQIKAIYGEILLDCEGAGKLPKKYDVFLGLIPTLIELSRVMLEQEDVSFISYNNAVAGAVEWCLKFGNEELLITVSNEITEFILNIGIKYEFRWILENSQTLLRVLENKKFRHILDERKDHIISKLEEGRGYFWDNNNMLIYKPICEVLIGYYKLLDYLPEEIRAIENSIGLSFEKSAELDAVHANKGGWYHKAIEYYISIGETNRLDELKTKMQSAYRMAIEKEMKPIMVPIKPSQEILDKIEVYRSASTPSELLSFVATDPDLLIKIEKIRAISESNAKEYILSSLMSGVVLDDGRIISKSANPEDNLSLQIRRNYSLSLSYISQLLLIEVLNILCSHASNSVEALLKIYEGWDFYNKDREIVLRTGFTRLFEGDYISAMHVLVPHFEACLRDMCSDAGICTIVSKDGIYQEQVLNELLRREEVKVLLQEDMHHYIETVMVSQNSFNLRNNIAHGLINSSMFTETTAAIVLHMYTLLFSYGVQNADSENVPTEEAGNCLEKVGESNDLEGGSANQSTN